MRRGCWRARSRMAATHWPWASRRARAIATGASWRSARSRWARWRVMRCCGDGRSRHAQERDSKQSSALGEQSPLAGAPLFDTRLGVTKHLTNLWARQVVQHYEGDDDADNLAGYGRTADNIDDI